MVRQIPIIFHDPPQRIICHWLRNARGGGVQSKQVGPPDRLSSAMVAVLVYEMMEHENGWKSSGHKTSGIEWPADETSLEQVGESVQLRGPLHGSEEEKKTLPPRIVGW